VLLDALAGVAVRHGIQAYHWALLSCHTFTYAAHENCAALSCFASLFVAHLGSRSLPTSTAYTRPDLSDCT
jgi:hypothetical protein